MKLLTNDTIGKFKLQLITDEKSDATIEKYIRDLRAFKIFLKGRELCKELVLQFKRFLIENYAPASVNSMLSSVNSFFDFVGWYELKVKTLKIQKKIFADKDKELTKDEYFRLLDAAKRKDNKKLYYLMQTICSCGIRVSELKHITIEAVKKQKATIRCKGKMRCILLPDSLCSQLKKYAGEQNITSGPVFITKSGKALDRSQIWKMMKALCESANVSRDKVFPHNLRHLFARTYYSIQKDIVRLADILGHSSINTTRIYTMETGEIHLKQIQSLGLIAKKNT